MLNDKTVLLALSGYQGADPLPPVLVAQNIEDGKLLKVWEITSARCVTAASEDAIEDEKAADGKARRELGEVNVAKGTPRSVAEHINKMFEGSNADSNGCSKQFANANKRACLTYVRQFRPHKNNVVGTVRTNMAGKVAYMYERHKAQIRKQFTTLTGIKSKMVKIGKVMSHSCATCVQLSVEIQLESESDFLPACPFNVPNAGARQNFSFCFTTLRKHTRTRPHTHM